MSTAIHTQEQLASVKQFNCQNCGAAHEVMNPRAQRVACQYCGSVLDAQSETHQILESLGKPEKHKPFSFIRLGQVASFHGRTYQVIARTRWRMRYQEYWSDEDGSGYSNEVWVYDEWLLIDARYTYFYLVEDKEGYWISEEIIPETPSLLPDNKRMSFFAKRPKQIVREYGEASVIHFEGESNYQIKRGDTIHFAMYRDRGIDYSAEWRLDDKGKEIKEVEFFREVPISRRKLLEAFDGNPAIDEIRAREAWWRSVFQVTGLAFLICLLFFAYSMFENGRVVASETFDLARLSEESEITTQAFEIKESGLFRLDLKLTDLPNNTEVFVFAYVLDSAKTAINRIEGNFYYYTGTDDEGVWVEEDRSAHKLFRLESPGIYYLQLFRQNSIVGGGKVQVEIRDGVILSRYFLGLSILFFLIMMVAWTKKG